MKTGNDLITIKEARNPVSSILYDKHWDIIYMLTNWKLLQVIHAAHEA